MKTILVLAGMLFSFAANAELRVDTPNESFRVGLHKISVVIAEDGKATLKFYIPTAEYKSPKMNVLEANQAAQAIRNSISDVICNVSKRLSYDCLTIEY